MGNKPTQGGTKPHGLTFGEVRISLWFDDKADGAAFIPTDAQESRIMRIKYVDEIGGYGLTGYAVILRFEDFREAEKEMLHVRRQILDVINEPAAR